VAGAAAAIFMRNPALITKQALLPAASVAFACCILNRTLQFPAFYVDILTRFPMPVKSVTTGITCAFLSSHIVPPAPIHCRSDTLRVISSRSLLKMTVKKPLRSRKKDTTGSAQLFLWRSAPFWPGQCELWCKIRPRQAHLTRLSRYTVWFDKIDRLPYMLYTLKQNARKQQIESILKYAMEKGLSIPAEIAKTPELHRITYVGSKILADQLVFSSLYVSAQNHSICITRSRRTGIQRTFSTALAF
jgi:hypothetical protein